MSEPKDNEHGATIVDDFSREYVRAECRCGWVGENVPIEAARTDAHRRHLAMADFAAHVHVAEGLAVEDEAGN